MWTSGPRPYRDLDGITLRTVIKGLRRTHSYSLFVLSKFTYQPCATTAINLLSSLSSPRTLNFPICIGSATLKKNKCKSRVKFNWITIEKLVQNWCFVEVCGSFSGWLLSRGCSVPVSRAGRRRAPGRAVCKYFETVPFSVCVPYTIGHARTANFATSYGCFSFRS